MLDRDSIRMSRLFQIHEQDTTDQVHSVDGVPVYTTAENVQFVVRNYMSADRLSLRIVPDVSIRATVSNGAALTYQGSYWVDASNHLRVGQITIGDEISQNTEEVNISIASVSTYGVTKLANTDSDDSTVVSTPANLRQKFDTTIKGGFTVVTNIHGSKWWLDDDKSRVYENGTVVRFLSGLHTVHFGDVENYTTPESQVIMLQAGAYQSIAGEYVKVLHTVTVVCDEPTAKWTPDNGNTWYSTGQTVRLNPGSYTLRFASVSGKTASDQRIVVNDMDLTIQVFYN